MILHIYVRVKFRSFGVTFGEIRRQYEVSFDGATVKFNNQAVSVPDHAKKLFDQRGVQVKCW